MPSSVFARVFGIRPAFFSNRGLNSFHSIAVFPPDEENDNTEIIFFGDGYMWEFNLRHNYSHTISDREDNAPLYLLTNGVFELTEPSAQGLNIHSHNPYTNAYGEKLLDTIRSRVMPFFDNPVSVNARTGGDGVYTFSNINTVVRYHDDDILTYASYKAVNPSITPDLLMDYAAAITFIEADELMQNEYFLTGFTVDNDRHIFRFDFLAGGFPHIISEDFKGSHIEVIVERGTVLRYRKYVYNFFVMP
jgi:hypothetical protein